MNVETKNGKIGGGIQYDNTQKDLKANIHLEKNQYSVDADINCNLKEDKVEYKASGKITASKQRNHGKTRNVVEGEISGEISGGNKKELEYKIGGKFGASQQRNHGKTRHDVEGEISGEISGGNKKELEYKIGGKFGASQQRNHGKTRNAVEANYQSEGDKCIVSTQVNSETPKREAQVNTTASNQDQSDQESEEQYLYI